MKVLERNALKNLMGGVNNTFSVPPGPNSNGRQISFVIDSDVTEYKCCWDRTPNTCSSCEYSWSGATCVKDAHLVQC